jgi:hypothetical protein
MSEVQLEGENMKILLIVSVFAFSGLSQARPLFPMTVKERLRLLLWTEGLNNSLQNSQPRINKPQLPEELEKPLQKF